jgi:hypothetical protein
MIVLVVVSGELVCEIPAKHRSIAGDGRIQSFSPIQCYGTPCKQCSSIIHLVFVLALSSLHF